MKKPEIVKVKDCRYVVNHSKVAKQVKAYREMRGVSQAQVGKHLGATPQYIYALENPVTSGKTWTEKRLAEVIEAIDKAAAEAK